MNHTEKYWTNSRKYSANCLQLNVCNRLLKTSKKNIQKKFPIHLWHHYFHNLKDLFSL